MGGRTARATAATSPQSPRVGTASLRGTAPNDPESGGLRDGGRRRLAAGASSRAAGAGPRAASAQHRPQNHRAAPRAAPADRPRRFCRRRAGRRRRRATAGSRRRCLPVGPRGSSASPVKPRAPRRSAAPRRSRGVVPCPARTPRRRRRWLAGRSFFARVVSSRFWHPRFTNKSCAADSCAAQERGGWSCTQEQRDRKNSCVQR